MAHFTYLVIFHLKMIVCQMLIYHIFMVIASKNIHLWYNHYQTFYMAHKFIPNHMESQCLVNITNFIKNKNHFNHFLNIFAFLVHCDFFFGHKYTITSHHMKLKSVIFLTFDFLGFWCIIICKNIVKILHNNDMVDIQTWEPWKTIECDNSFAPPIVCFHLHNHTFIFLKFIHCMPKHMPLSVH